MNEALWRRVEAALDDRCDPFADPQLAADLASDRRASRETRRLMNQLAMLEKLPQVRRRPTRRWQLTALAAATLLIAIGVRTAASGSRAEERQTAQIEATSAVSLVVEHLSPPPARRARVVLEPRRVLGWTLEGEAP